MLAHNRRLQTALWWASFLCCGLVFCMHFTLVQLSNMPLNPVKLELYDLVNNYVNPWFTQNWSFFAPQPIDHDLSLLVRGRYREGRTGKTVTTPWLDVSDPLYAALRQNRLTPIQLVELMLSNAVVGYSNTASKDPRATITRNGQTYLRPVIPASVDPYELNVLTRTGMAALERTYPDAHFTSVQVGLLTYTFPRFTERDKPDAAGKGTLTMVQWQSAAPVAPF